MPKILLILSAIMLAVSAFLGFSNKTKLVTTQTDLKTSKADATAAHADATKTHGELKKTKSDLDASVKKSDELQASLTAAQAQVTDLTGKVTEATTALAAKEAQLKELNDKLTKTPGGPAVDPAKIAEQIDSLTKERDELKLVKEGMESQLKAAQSQLAAAVKENRDRATGASMNGLRGRILAVNRQWNFVVLDLGNNRGVNNNATMLVERNGGLVGKLKITSVEPTQSIADIVPNSVPAGVDVQPGDTVVFPGT